MLEFVNTYIIGAALPLILSASGLFFGIYTGVWSPKLLRAGLRSLFEKESGASDATTVSPGRALSLALAGTLGVGNIVGVSAAIWWGGAGAVFWMWLSAILATSLKYAETVLGVRFKIADGDQTHGGAPIYIEKAFSARGHRRLGKLLGTMFALLCLLDAVSMGCIIQTNAVAGALEGTLGLDVRLCGLIFGITALIIASGGLRRISSACAALVPFMTAGFCILSVAVLCIKAAELPRVINEIVRNAFDFQGASLSSAGGGLQAFFSGVGGFFVSRSVRYGVMRGLISNEAGCGTSPLAHSASSTNSAFRQGFLGIIEVIVDTVLLCTVTALAVLCNYDAAVIYGDNSVMMTISAYTAALGDWAGLPLCLSVLLFGIATVICWAYYGCECVRMLGIPQKHQKRAAAIFDLVYAVSAYIGAVSPPGGVWTLADLAIGCMTFINLIALFLMRRVIRSETLSQYGADK